MRMAKAFITAVPLALLLVAAVLVAAAVSPGTFGFDSWPTSPAAPPRANAVVIEQPLAVAPHKRVAPDQTDGRKRNGTRGSSEGVLIAGSEGPASRRGSGTPQRALVERGGRPETSTDGQAPAPADGSEPVAPAPDSAPSPAPAAPDVVAIEPDPSTPSEPQADVEARPAAPVGIPAAPVADEERDGHGPHWGLRGPHGHHGNHGHHGRGPHGNAHGHRDDRN
jgi:hypothetical protein